MPAIVNSYFNQNKSNEQSLLDKIKTESIQVMGRQILYIPRRIQKIDLILGEDVLSKFDVVIPLEMYMENATGYEGEKELYSKFGLEIHSSYTLVLSQSRWITEVASKPEYSFMKVQERPQEGDLIYDPLTKALYEVKFVDNDRSFFQVGKNYFYHLSCEMFQYSSETFNTGITEVDGFDDLNSLDILNDQILMEDGFVLNQETGSSIILNTQDSQAFDPGFVANDRSDGFDEEASKIKFLVANPFDQA